MTVRAQMITVAVLVSVAVVVGEGLLVYHLEMSPTIGPGVLFLVSANRVEPGNLGCAAVAGEECFNFTLGLTPDGVRLSELQFDLTNQSADGAVGPGGEPVHVGPSAGVSVLQSPGTIAGGWNWSTRTWASGSSWVLPDSMTVDVVFDSGLHDSPWLAGTSFWVTLQLDNAAAGADLP